MATKPQIIAHPLSSVICLRSSAERSEVPARRETIYMQNKPNLRKAQINVSPVLIKNYEENRPPNPAKTNPIQTQLKPNLTQLNPIQSQFQKRPKMNISSVLTKDYENIRLRRCIEVPAVLINLPLNPADKTNWSHPQAQGTRKDMPHCRRFLIEKCRNANTTKPDL